MFNKGDHVTLVETIPDDVTNGLKIGMTGIVEHGNHAGLIGVWWDNLEMGHNLAFDRESGLYHKKNGWYVGVSQVEDSLSLKLRNL